MLKCFNWYFQSELIFTNSELLPLSPTYFPIQQAIKPRENRSRRWPSAVRERGCGAAGTALVRTASLPQQSGLCLGFCLALSPHSLRRQWHRNALAHSDLAAVAAKQQSDWAWNIYERQSRRAENPEMQYLPHMSFIACSWVIHLNSALLLGAADVKWHPRSRLSYSRFPWPCWMAGSASQHFISAASLRALCAWGSVSPASLISTSCPCKATCKCVYRSSMIISYSSGWLTCQKGMPFSRPLFLQVPLV